MLTCRNTPAISQSTSVCEKRSILERDCELQVFSVTRKDNQSHCVATGYNTMNISLMTLISVYVILIWLVLKRCNMTLSMFTCAMMRVFSVETFIIEFFRVYLMRQIMRQFGMEALRQIGAELDGQWVIPPEARDNQVCPSAMVLHRQKYLSHLDSRSIANVL